MLDKEEKSVGDIEQDEDQNNPHISLFHFRCIGLLWCEGSAKEKAFEFYDMLQGDQKKIACNDKEFKPSFFTLLDMASEMTCKLAPKYTNTKSPMSV